MRQPEYYVAETHTDADVPTMWARVEEAGGKVMGIIIICIIFIIGGIIASKFENEFEALEYLGVVGIILGGVVLIVVVVISISICIDETIQTAEYELNIHYFNAIKFSEVDPFLASTLVKTFHDINLRIINSKKWRDNFFIGIFFPYGFGDLKLFEIELLLQEAK